MCSWPKEKLALYTFGAPMVGNKAFAKELEMHVPYAWNIYNIDDILPHIPVSSDYVPAGRSLGLQVGRKGIRQMVFSNRHALIVEGAGNAPVTTKVRALKVPRRPNISCESLTSACMSVLNWQECSPR
jgi:hypothetical protein